MTNALKYSISLVSLFLIFENSAVFSQSPPGSEANWQSVYGLSAETQVPPNSPLPPARNPDPVLGMRVAESVPFSVGTGLPNNHGQIGRAYNITPYTNRPSLSQTPQTTITSWILRRTGTEIWHGEPFGFMSATREQLSVYHTPEMQNLIAETVDRFVSTKNAQKMFSLRIVSLGSPDWRNSNRNYTYLTPIRIDTPGVQGWLVSKTHVGLLLDNITRRNDAREHVSANSALVNAQTTVVPYHATRYFVRDVQVRPSAPGGYITDPTMLTEGFQFEVTPLISLDGKTLEARIKCDMVQVDRMHPLTFSTPSSASPSAKVTVEKPQVANFSVDELISWPSDHVLLLDLGIVPLLIPMPQQTQDKSSLIDQVVGPLVNSAPPKRSNVLMLVGLQSDVGTTNLGNPVEDNLSISFDPEPLPASERMFPNSQPSNATQLPPANPVISNTTPVIP